MIQEREDQRCRDYLQGGGDNWHNGPRDTVGVEEQHRRICLLDTWVVRFNRKASNR